jgi:type III secretion system YscD/HrpQ family protein
MNASSTAWSAQKFTRLFTRGADTLRNEEALDFESTSYALRVLKGKHVGATQALDAQLHTVGGGLDNDLVLLDLFDVNLRIEKRGTAYQVFREEAQPEPPNKEASVQDTDANETFEQAEPIWVVVAPAEHYERTSPRADEVQSGGYIAHSVSHVELCDVYVFANVAFEVVTVTQFQRSALSSSPKPTRRGAATKVLLVSSFFALTGIVYAISLAFSHDDGDGATTRGNVALAQSKFGNVHMRRSIDGGAEFSGVVADEKEQAALSHWARVNGLTHVPVRVLRLDKFRDKLSESLSGADVKVQLTSTGALRVDGNIKSPAISARLNTIIKEIGDVAVIENRLVVTPEVQQTKQELPFRVATLRPGNPGYVELEGGLRYFVGSTIPEGYEVVSVSANSARFARGGKEAVYTLN